MKNIFLQLLLFCFYTAAHAQLDTIYTLDETLIGTVKELGITELKYTKPKNNEMQIVIPKATINKIHFANGEIMVLDSTIFMYSYANICNTEKPILTHFKKETDSLVYIGEFVCGAPANYYFNATKRPQEVMFANILAIAKYHSADLVYLAPDAFIDAETEDKTGAYTYGVKAKFYTKKLQDFSYIQAMIVLNKTYTCKIVKEKRPPVVEWSTDENEPNRKIIQKMDTVNAQVRFLSTQIVNNRCALQAIIGNVNAESTSDIDVIYADVNYLIGDYEYRDKKRKLLFDFLPNPTEKKRKRD